MSVNFNDEEAIIVFDGVEIRIQKERAKDIAKEILSYFEED